MSERYRELVAKVDAFFARVEEKYGARMQCASGCFDCCKVQLTVTSVEAHEVRALLATLEPEARERLRARAAHPADDRCSALDEDGRCAIYAARPLVCRSHGVPIRLRDGKGLPMLDACYRNFRDAGLGAVSPDCVLDQQTLSTLLHAVDAEHSAAAGSAAGVRIALAEILRE